MGEWLTRVTVWAALLGYAAGAACLLLSRRSPKWSRPARLAWTFGCAWFLAHVLCAFAFHYGWSHATAFRETARQTGEIVGTNVVTLITRGAAEPKALPLMSKLEAAHQILDEVVRLRRA